MRVYIDSGAHVDSNLMERIREIERALERPELIFYEGDSSAFNTEAVRHILGVSLIAPLIGIAAIIQVYLVTELLGKIYSILGGESRGRDSELVQELKKRHNIESQEVDQGLFPFIYTYRGPLASFNWALLTIIYFVRWPVHPLVLVLVLGYLLLLVVLGIANPSRNRHMADAISEASSKYDNVCLVTGEAHHKQVGQLLEERDGIEVVNPTPVNYQFSTRIVSLFSNIFNS